MPGASGRSGRRPAPTKLKVLRGNPGKRRLSDGEPDPETNLPEPPDHLSEEAKSEWERVGQLLTGLGMVSDLDRAGLAAYCQAWGRWVEAEESLRKCGLVVKSPNGYLMQSPFLAIANKAMEQMKALLIEFGMTPASRTRVHADLPPEEDEFEKFLRS